jgi:5-methyltetrahydropteroyltriglutamate--homocysteine methyltransferase
MTMLATNFPQGDFGSNSRTLKLMVQTRTPPFRADHVGSLLRPPELLRAREDHHQGRISSTDLRRIEDAAIRETARRQEDLGLQAVTDGEFAVNRGTWTS